MINIKEKKAFFIIQTALRFTMGLKLKTLIIKLPILFLILLVNANS